MKTTLDCLLLTGTVAAPNPLALGVWTRSLSSRGRSSRSRHPANAVRRYGTFARTPEAISEPDRYGSGRGKCLHMTQMEGPNLSRWWRKIYLVAIRGVWAGSPVISRDT